MIHIFINILIITLIFVFVIILNQQLFFPKHKIENFKNNTKNKDKTKPYPEDDDSDAAASAAFILAQQNAGNINILKDRVGHLEVLKNQVLNNSNKIKVLEDELQEILEQQQSIASKISTA
jgi:methyl-accepting chemotaxis protein